MYNLGNVKKKNTIFLFIAFLLLTNIFAIYETICYLLLIKNQNIKFKNLFNFIIFIILLTISNLLHFFVINR